MDIFRKDLLREMLIRENELRLHPDTQKYYEHLEREPLFDGKHRNREDYTETLQKKVLIEFGFDSENTVILVLLKNATIFYPELADLS